MSEALRLFLIENDDDVALLIRKSLGRVGHHVTCCRTAADALIVLAQSNFDLVLLDQFLDDMTGLELLHLFAREGITVPVLVVTVEATDTQLATRVLHAGALDYIVKDAALTFLLELPKRVSEAVSRHRLEHLNRLLIQALESARDGIMITDLNGTILEVNQSLEGLTGYNRQELVGQTPRLLKSGAHPPAFYAEMWRTILARGSWQGELTNRRRDGTLVPTSMTISPIVDNQGRLTHFVGIQRDVTAHKQLERQLLQAQKMQSVGTLAGGVAHEFNNLLAGINGYASLGLREPDIGPTVREFFQNVVNLSERAAVLTRQLLAFARKPALVRQRTDLRELMRSTAELVARTLRQEVALDLPDESAPLLVEADANQLQQALVNLALNGRDAMLARPNEEGRELGAGHDKIVFGLRRAVLNEPRPGFPQRVPPGDYLVVEVRDHGCGMSQEVLNQALDPFFTTKEVGQGTGLGLPMVFGIVQGHHGFLTLDSTPGAGTCAGLYLPRHVDRPATRPAAEGSAVGGSFGGEVFEPESAPGKSILVIDDEEAVLDVVRRFLQIAGHRVTCASSGQEALSVSANGQAIDLIILDLMMPREDVGTTFQRLKVHYPGAPILLCTGLAAGGPEQFPHAGAAGILRKPFRMNELWYAVTEALREGDKVTV